MGEEAGSNTVSIRRIALIAALAISAMFCEGWQYTDLPMLECAWCHRKASLTVRLERHHELPQCRFPELRNDPNNLIVLCHADHIAIGHRHNTKTYNPDVGVIVECYQRSEPNVRGAE